MSIPYNGKSHDVKCFVKHESSSVVDLMIFPNLWEPRDARNNKEACKNRELSNSRDPNCSGNSRELAGKEEATQRTLATPVVINQVVF